MLEEIWDAVVAKLRTAWGLAGSLLMFVSPLASLAFRGRVPPRSAPSFRTWFSSPSPSFCSWSGWRPTLGRLHSHRARMSTCPKWTRSISAPSLTPQIVICARFPHSLIEFSVAIRWVQHRPAHCCSNSAIGMRLTDQAERNVGFFDVFRLRKEALQCGLMGVCLNQNSRRL